MANKITDNDISTKNHVVEWAPFTIKDGVTEQTLLTASQALQNDFLSIQSGFIKRDLLKGEGKKWIDIVYWASYAEAQKAMKAADHNDVCFQYFSLMQHVDHNSPEEGVSHFRVIESY